MVVCLCAPKLLAVKLTNLVLMSENSNAASSAAAEWRGLLYTGPLMEQCIIDVRQEVQQPPPEVLIPRKVQQNLQLPSLGYLMFVHF